MSYQDRARALRERADQPHPEAWIPENIGDEILGVVSKMQVLEGAYGPVPVVTVANDAGLEKSVWLHHQTLRNKLRDESLQEGEMIYIRWDGKVPSKSGGPDYHTYTVAIDRPERPFDWSSLDDGDVSAADRALARKLAGEEFPTTPAPDEDIPF